MWYYSFPDSNNLIYPVKILWLKLLSAHGTLLRYQFQQFPRLHRVETCIEDTLQLVKYREQWASIKGVLKLHSYVGQVSA